MSKRESSLKCILSFVFDSYSVAGKVNNIMEQSILINLPWAIRQAKLIGELKQAFYRIYDLLHIC